MKYIKAFNDILNEGAYLDDSGNLILNPRNDSKNNNEVLKTTGAQIGKRVSGVSFFKDIPLTGQVSPMTWMFPKFHGLSVNSYKGKIDHPGRFKYTMDKLKAGEIEDIETSLPDFIRFSFNVLKIREWASGSSRISYLIATGSTKGLVAKLCNAIKQVTGRDIPVISLRKVEYLNAGDAIDWDEVRDQMIRQAKPSNLEGIKTLNQVKSVLTRYIDRELTDRTALEAIKSARTADELKEIVIGLDSKIVWLPFVDEERMIPFIVRSSGRDTGGTRSFWRKKYNYSEERFMKAVIDCVSSIKTSSPKKMLVVDDNINSGNDVRLTKANIESIINNLFPGQNTNQFKAKSLFGFYVLYDMGKPTDLEYTIDGVTSPTTNKPIVFKDFKRDSDTVQDFSRFTGYPNIKV